VAEKTFKHKQMNVRPFPYFHSTRVRDNLTFTMVRPGPYLHYCQFKFSIFTTWAPDFHITTPTGLIALGDEDSIYYSIEGIDYLSFAPLIDVLVILYSMAVIDVAIIVSDMAHINAVVVE
jgi:hypothetical protein